MDAILSSLLNFGIGGAMAAAVLLVLYNLTQKTIPAMVDKHRADEAAARAEFISTLSLERTEFKEALAGERAEFRAALTELNTTYRESLSKVEIRWQHSADAICSRLESVDRHAKANQENVAVLRDHIAKITGQRPPLVPVDPDPKEPPK